MPELSRSASRRKTNGAAALSCERADGSVTWQRQEGQLGRFFPLHDLTHFAVETVLGFDARSTACSPTAGTSRISRHRSEERLTEQAHARRDDRRLLRRRAARPEHSATPTISRGRSSTYREEHKMPPPSFGSPTNRLDRDPREARELFAAGSRCPRAKHSSCGSSRDSHGRRRHLSPPDSVVRLSRSADEDSRTPRSRRRRRRRRASLASFAVRRAGLSFIEFFADEALDAVDDVADAVAVGLGLRDR